jgi:hypothetical protein
MNINEKCLLKFLTNPIETINQEKDLYSNVNKCKDFAFADIYSNAIQNIMVSK